MRDGGEGQAEILPECKIYNNIFYSYSKEIYSILKKKKKSLKSRVEFSLFPQGFEHWLGTLLKLWCETWLSPPVYPTVLYSLRDFDIREE